MCRFCQPGHVTLPIRERKAEDIIKIAKELVKNTGYDEYSLLSLSSNDYKNINEVIKELSVDFFDKKVSVSLPSQRIDGFNLELANLVQSVRKSTMTLAPEAGSQRLRNVIKKNITEDQIINAVTTLYENGWSRVKFYFICGLPTETLQDMDEMAELLSKIKYRCKQIKKEKNLNHGMDITCTLSIFVPKPFTPFQWCPQMNLNTVTEHIRYLKDKIAHLKGIKINYHEQFTSQLEAVLTRGSIELCKYIEALYKKGCYLDAWGEYFNENIWSNAAAECEINPAELAEKEYKLHEELPWDFIDTGLKKEWLVNEYKNAFSDTSKNIVPTCENQCVNCGVCQNLKTKKVIAPKYILKNSVMEEIEKQKILKHRDPKTQSITNNIYKYRIKMTKTGNLKYFSHLDWQNTFLKSLSRTDLKIAYSQGFNPMMKVSMGIALPLFTESSCELVDIELTEYTESQIIKQKLEKVLPFNCKIISIVNIDKSAKAIDITAQWAEYKIRISDKSLYDFKNLRYNTDNVLSSPQIFTEKKNKKGLLKKIDIKPSIKSYRFEYDSLFIILKTGQKTDKCDIPALRADVLMNLIAPDTLFNIERIRFFDSDMREL